MKSLRTTRLMAPLIVGLYFIAQIVGITSLVATHLHHVYESEIATAEDIATTGHVERGHKQGSHHQHGVGDPGDQCCNVHHHLSAVLPLDLTHNPLSLPSTSLLLPLPDHLVGAEPRLPDRPPKLLPSV